MDSYYIRSLAATCLFLGALEALLFVFVLATGIYGAASVCLAAALLLAYFYRLPSMIFTAKAKPASPGPVRKRAGAKAEV